MHNYRVSRGHSEKVTIKTPQGSFRSFEESANISADIAIEYEDISECARDLRNRAAVMVWNDLRKDRAISDEEYKALLSTFNESELGTVESLRGDGPEDELPLEEFQPQPPAPQTPPEPPGLPSKSGPRYINDGMAKKLWCAQNLCPEAVDGLLKAQGQGTYKELKRRNFANFTIAQFDAVVQSPNIAQALELDQQRRNQG